MIKRVAVLVSGSGSNLQALIDAKQAGALPHGDLALVIGSKEGLFALERAKKHGIPHHVVCKKDHLSQADFDQAMLDLLSGYEIDCLVLAGYLGILSKAIISMYPKQILNVHPALIPSFCGKGFYGLHVHEAVLAKGVKVTGATVHFVDHGIDTGAILLQGACGVQADDTPEVLQKRVLKIEHDLLPLALHALTSDSVIWQGELAFTKD